MSACRPSHHGPEALPARAPVHDGHAAGALLLARGQLLPHPDQEERGDGGAGGEVLLRDAAGVHGSLSIRKFSFFFSPLHFWRQARPTLPISAIPPR